jgi:hypothetical protein
MRTSTPHLKSLLPGISIVATRLRLAANALAPSAATAPAAMIEIVCTRLDMIIVFLPDEAADAAPDCWLFRVAPIAI